MDIETRKKVKHVLYIQQEELEVLCEIVREWQHDIARLLPTGETAEQSAVIYDLNTALKNGRL